MMNRHIVGTYKYQSNKESIIGKLWEIMGNKTQET